MLKAAPWPTVLHHIKNEWLLHPAPTPVGCNLKEMVPLHFFNVAVDIYILIYHAVKNDVKLQILDIFPPKSGTIL